MMVAFSVASANADPLPEPWESQRQEIIGLAQIACTGEPDYVNYFWVQIEIEENPVAQNSMEWLTENCDSFDLSNEDLAALQRKSAEAGYPIGMYNYAARLLDGDGVPADIDQAERLFKGSAEAGYGVAAVALSYLYADARFLSRDLDQARTYLAFAEREGVGDRALDDARQAIARAEQEILQGAQQSAAVGGDASEGEMLHRVHCFACHPVDPYRSGIGPSFYQLFGRTAGSVEGFRYSGALEEAGQKGLVWSVDNVGEYLSGPDDFLEEWSWDRQRHPVECRRDGNTRRNAQRQDLVRIVDCEVSFNSEDMRNLAAFLETQ